MTNVNLPIFVFESLREGMEVEQKKTKQRRVFGTKPTARTGWPKRLRLVRATQRTEVQVDVIGAQLCSLQGNLPCVALF